MAETGQFRQENMIIQLFLASIVCVVLSMCVPLESTIKGKNTLICALRRLRSARASTSTQSGKSLRHPLTRETTFVTSSLFYCIQKTPFGKGSTLKGKGKKSVLLESKFFPFRVDPYLFVAVYFFIIIFFFLLLFFFFFFFVFFFVCLFFCLSASPIE